ncbi:MAG: hypothetical protein LBH51_03930 [Treponema sp.]|jgi:hypothetical protein|nr:hypothetical protein [Treponema sp.]
MRPVEHFLSQLDRLERGSSAGAEEQALRGFTDLVSPVIGRAGARDLGGALLGELREKPGPGGPFYMKLGYAAAFLLGEFDDSMELEAGEWEEIRFALEEAAGEMDLNTLAALMGDLLERGKLF